MVTREQQWALRMMADELNISKQTILQLLHEDLHEE
jgi:predicted nuclease of restriction endonuclease-like RecB superfamily